MRTWTYIIIQTVWTMIRQAVQHMLQKQTVIWVCAESEAVNLAMSSGINFKYGTQLKYLTQLLYKYTGKMSQVLS